MFDQVRSVREALTEVADALEPGVFDGPGAARMVRELARVEHLAAAAKTLMVARVEQTNVWKTGGHRSVAHWLAQSTSVSLGEAIGAVETATRLPDCPRTEERMRAGRLSPVQARTITDAAACVPEREADLLATAATETVSGLRDECRIVKAAAAADTDTARRAHVQRRFRPLGVTDGLWRGEIAGPVAACGELLALLEPFTEQAFRAARGDGRHEPAEAYRFDALLGLARAASDGGRATGRAKTAPRAQVHLHADVGALRRGELAPGERCEIPGVGPVSLADARALLGDSLLTVVLTTGAAVTTIAHPGRTIPAAVRRALDARDQRCRVPGCGVRDHLQIHHIESIADGGTTTLENCVKVCAYHHRLITHHGYELRRVDDTTYSWHTPTIGDAQRAPPRAA
ncbi:MAG TPA: DUF222 domain-containing protein [Acidimicrobiia bacterium]|nr:DUF222 domain-containing protein [Acidimicrobiia bacterium]